MDLATIVGIICALAAMAVGIGTGVAAFINIPSLLIVVGGTFGAAMVNYRFPQLIGAFAVAKQAFLYKPTSPTELIEELGKYAHQARREGILALESAAEEADDMFLKRALQLAVDGHEVPAIESILNNEIDQIKERHKSGAEIFTALASYSPAFGMIGTLIGLVLMLQSMNDPSTIGPSMAIALITTFYGAVMANLAFLPIAGKLRSRSQEELLYKELTMEGVLSISLGDNPRIVEQKLISYLEPRLRAMAERK